MRGGQRGDWGEQGGYCGRGGGGLSQFHFAPAACGRFGGWMHGLLAFALDVDALRPAPSSLSPFSSPPARHSLPTLAGIAYPATAVVTSLGRVSNVPLKILPIERAGTPRGIACRRLCTSPWGSRRGSALALSEAPDNDWLGVQGVPCRVMSGGHGGDSWSRKMILPAASLLPRLAAHTEHAHKHHRDSRSSRAGPTSLRRTRSPSQASRHPLKMHQAANPSPVPVLLSVVLRINTLHKP